MVLHAASKEGTMDTVKRLPQDGAEVDKEDNDGFVALDIAILNDKLDISKELYKKISISTDRLGDSSSSLYRAAYLGQLSVARELINRGVDIEVKDNNGRIPLHWVSQTGHLGATILPVDNRADINTKKNDGSTPPNSATPHLSSSIDGQREGPSRTNHPFTDRRRLKPYANHFNKSDT